MSDLNRGEYEFSKPPEIVIPDDPRFNATIRVLGENATNFFGAARLATDYAGYFRVFRRALKVVEFKPLETGAYGKWLTLDIPAEVKLGRDGTPLTDEQMVMLAGENDPAMFVIARLEAMRQDQYPSIEHDVKHSQQIYGAYTLLAAGVHHDRVFE